MWLLSAPILIWLCLSWMQVTQLLKRRQERCHQCLGQRTASASYILPKLFSILWSCFAHYNHICNFSRLHCSNPAINQHIQPYVLPLVLCCHSALLVSCSSWPLTFYSKAPADFYYFTASFWEKTKQNKKTPNNYVLYWCQLLSINFLPGTGTLCKIIM